MGGLTTIISSSNEGEVARLRRERERDGGRFVVVGALNQELVGLIGGEEVWGLRVERVLLRGGYSERAGGWLERERGRLEREGRSGGASGEGVVAGLEGVRGKWILKPAAAVEVVSASMLGAQEVGGGGGGAEGEEGSDGGGSREEIRTRTQKSIMAPPSTSKNQKVLPEGYYFSKVRREELHIVISRSNLPSTGETLAGLSSVALRYRTPSPKSAREKKTAGEIDNNEYANSGELI